MGGKDRLLDLLGDVNRAWCNVDEACFEITGGGGEKAQGDLEKSMKKVEELSDQIAEVPISVWEELLPSLPEGKTKELCLNVLARNKLP